jgi:hypothetical protein
MANPKKYKKTKVVCDDEVCLLEEQEVTAADSSNAWLDIFCPQYSCELTSPTQLP